MTANKTTPIPVRRRASGAGQVIEADFTDANPQRPVRDGNPEPDNRPTFAERFDRAFDHAKGMTTDNPAGSVPVQSSPSEDEWDDLDDLSYPPTPSYQAASGAVVVLPSNLPATVDRDGTIANLVGALGTAPTTQEITTGGLVDISVADAVAREVITQQAWAVVDSYFEKKRIHDALYKGRFLNLGVVPKFFANVSAGQSADEQMAALRQTELAMTQTLGGSMVDVARQAGPITASAMANEVIRTHEHALTTQRLKARHVETVIENLAFEQRSRTEYKFGTEMRQGIGKAIAIRAQNEGQLDLVLNDYIQENEINYARFERRPEFVEQEILERTRRVNGELQKLRKEMRVRGVASNRLVYEVIEKGLAAEVIDAVVDARHEIAKMANSAKPRVRVLADEPDITSGEE